MAHAKDTMDTKETNNKNDVTNAKTSSSSQHAPVTQVDLTVPVDFVVFGLGIPDPNFIISRHNSGFIFADYLANCIAMQIAIMQHGDADVEADDLKIPDAFKKPVFVRDAHLFADVHDIEFSVTPEKDFVANTVAGQRTLSNVTAEKGSKTVFRIIIAKPLTGMSSAGESLRRILSLYQITDVKNQLVVVTEDVGTLQGSISLRSGADNKGISGNDGLEGIVNYLKSTDFIRLQLGVGRPPAGQSYEQFIYSPFLEDNKEMDLFGHTLDVAAQAFQYYVVFKDFKKARQKYANSKKLPKTLRKMAGLVFPLEMEGIPPAAVDDATVKEETETTETNNKAEA